MGKAANVEMGINVPDFVSNKDVYDSLDKAAASLEENHIDVTDLAVTGLDYEGDSNGSSDHPQDG